MEQVLFGKQIRNYNFFKIYLGNLNLIHSTSLKELSFPIYLENPNLIHFHRYLLLLLGPNSEYKVTWDLVINRFDKRPAGQNRGFFSKVAGSNLFKVLWQTSHSTSLLFNILLVLLKLWEQSSFSFCGAKMVLPDGLGCSQTSFGLGWDLVSGVW